MSLTISAPNGAAFEFGNVKTAHGEKALGEVPLLVWNDISAAREHFGDEGLRDVLNGTSLRVAYQAIARRMRIAGKTDDEIAQAQIEYRPGKRAVGESTPRSRARKAADAAAQKLSDPDLLTRLLQKIESGELSEDELSALESE